jgi:hypothetical protein
LQRVDDPGDEVNQSLMQWSAVFAVAHGRVFIKNFGRRYRWGVLEKLITTDPLLPSITEPNNSHVQQLYSVVALTTWSVCGSSLAFLCRASLNLNSSSRQCSGLLRLASF